MSSPTEDVRRPNARLTWEDVQWVRDSDPKTPPVEGVEKKTSTEAALELGVTAANIRHIRRGDSWKEIECPEKE